jgi:putative SOS response-associated peptidase YedK
MFRGALARRRCPCAGRRVHEWKLIRGTKQPYTIARADGDIFALGGMWESWRASSGKIERTFAIAITTRPNAEVILLHRRMPLTLEAQVLARLARRDRR